ncbi:MAG TPA: hypothetical protein PLB90_13690 [Opitutaceae bacterium]|nr:hypothetical protein [Opitutaceae bacterium]
MTPFVLITLLLASLAGTCALWYAVAHAVQGYQDETGFHEGPEPRPLESAVGHRVESFGTWTANSTPPVTRRRTAKRGEFEHAAVDLG